MKNNFSIKCLRLSFILLLSILFDKNIQAQQSLINVNGWNAYVHVPWDYSSNPTKTYPTIIFFPGIDEIGSNASLAILNGPGTYIKQGWNGNVKVGTDSVKFIVITLQPSSAYPRENTINTCIQTLKGKYRMDNSRINLTGLSMGGWCSTTFVTADTYGGPYTYASQVATVVEVEGMKPADNSPYPNLFDNFAKSNGRLLSLEQLYDGRDAKTRVNRMNSTKANSGIYVSTKFGTGGHCCWEQFYGGNGVTPSKFTLDGISQNIYEWMARNRLGNQKPVAKAGSDKIMTLPANSVTLSGSGTDADGNIASYAWTKIAGPTSGTIVSPKSASTNITGLKQGTYTFCLTVTDNKGLTAKDSVLVTVKASSLKPAMTLGGDNESIAFSNENNTLNAGSAELISTDMNVDHLLLFNNRLSVNLTSGKQQKINIRIIDIKGITYFTDELFVRKGMNKISRFIPGLSRGLLYIRFVTLKQMIVKPVFNQN